MSRVAEVSRVISDKGPRMMRMVSKDVQAPLSRDDHCLQIALLPWPGLVEER